jgi:hypothetical protein
MKKLTEQPRMDAISAIIANPNPHKDFFRDEVGELIIDTTYAEDTGKWETGIFKNGTWIIVSQYENKEEADKEHQNWVKKVTKNPSMKLKDIWRDN